MARQTYADVNTAANSNSDGFKVGFFAIKNGEEAIVRFAINSVDDFDIFTVHPITIGQSSYPNRRVSCLRNNPKTDPINMCPLCAKGEKVQQRMYIKMIQYVNENGQIIPKAVIWDRPAYSYAPQLKSYLDNYGPLTNIICKIVRHGEGLDTNYDIIPNLNPQLYSDQMYVKDFSAFDDFNVLGGMIMNKSFEDINQFVLTGEFPAVSPNHATPQTVTTSQTDVPPWNTPVQDVPMQEVPTVASTMSRPVRYY